MRAMLLKRRWLVSWSLCWKIKALNSYLFHATLLSFFPFQKLHMLPLWIPIIPFTFQDYLFSSKNKRMLVISIDVIWIIFRVCREWKRLTSLVRATYPLFKFNTSMTTHMQVICRYLIHSQRYFTTLLDSFSTLTMPKEGPIPSDYNSLGKEAHCLPSCMMCGYHIYIIYYYYTLFYCRGKYTCASI